MTAHQHNFNRFNVLNHLWECSCGLAWTVASIENREAQPSPAVGASLPVPQRYDLVTNYRCGSSIEEMERSDDGDWLRWDDALAMVDEVRTEHDAWDKRRVAEVEELRRRHHETQAALLVLKGEMEQRVEQLCRFNCDAESSCRCDAHEMYQTFRRLTNGHRRNDSSGGA